MDYILVFIIIVLALVVGFLLAQKYGSPASNAKRSFAGWFKVLPLDPVNQQRIQKRQEALQKVMELFVNQEKITNSDIQKLLSISDATANNYLNQLQKEGNIAQHGSDGHSVFYTKLNP